MVQMSLKWSLAAPVVQPPSNQILSWNTIKGPLWRPGQGDSEMSCFPGCTVTRGPDIGDVAGCGWVSSTQKPESVPIDDQAGKILGWPGCNGWVRSTL